METKLEYLLTKVKNALLKFPELQEEIFDIYDYCMLFAIDSTEVFINELDSAIQDLNDLLERNQQETNHTNWLTEGETEYERNL
jgi:hypothetical protein